MNRVKDLYAQGRPARAGVALSKEIDDAMREAPDVAADFVRLLGTALFTPRGNEVNNER